MKVELENLTKKWGDVVGVDSIDLDIKEWRVRCPSWALRVAARPPHY